MPYQHSLIAFYLLAINAISFLAYGLDKRCAERDQWRIAERTLHALALCGGWPGAFIGHRCFHHKTRNASFQFVFFATVIINCFCVVWLISA